MHLDFVFFNEIDGKIRPSIVDPYCTYLDDAIVKSRSLARRSEEFGEAFHRIDAIAAIPRGDLQVLDMKKVVRDSALNGGLSASEPFAGQLAGAYT